MLMELGTGNFVSPTGSGVPMLMRLMNAMVRWLSVWVLAVSVFGAEEKGEIRPGDRMLAEYFEAETDRLAKECLNEIQSLEDWTGRRELYRKQLFEMLSLDPLPARTDLRPVVTGRTEQPDFIVEKLHFQSLPGLYVTGNLYLPRRIEKPLPAILYVCGHARVVKEGVSYGNKAGYQHHGAWFARNGYVCLTIDTIQLGEIEGLHHGTYREGMWWWSSRGYTPAGVEAWNGIRALDYLETRSEVDASRMGVTGRSGGGAYSWWLVALDDRVKVAAPVAGITDLENHVVDGVVEGHCDCMFVVNTYQWDYAQVAALAAPRPLLIANSDKDSIFPLSGVQRVHEQVRRIYQLHKASDKLGLLITEGPHKDTQDLQLPVFRWFNRHLKGEDPIIEMAAVKFFEPEQLKVFGAIPADERTSNIHETFVPLAAVSEPPKSAAHWKSARDWWETVLREKCFRAWPSEATESQLQSKGEIQAGGIRLQKYELESQSKVRLPLWVFSAADRAPVDRVSLVVADEDRWVEFETLVKEIAARRAERDVAPVNGFEPGEGRGLRAVEKFAEKLRSEKMVVVAFPPRGIGPTAWSDNDRKRVQNRRRFLLLGQTLDGMRVWDIRRAIGAVRKMEGLASKPLTVEADRNMGVNVIYAAIFEPNLNQVDLRAIPHSHRTGPDYLNVLRYLDVPQAVALAAEKTPIVLRDSGSAEWEFAIQVSRNLGWGEDRVQAK